MISPPATTMTADNDRAAERLAWVRATLAEPSLMLEPASADASFRSYWRTVHDGRSWIVMDSPPAQEDPQPWLEIGARLQHAGLHVPVVRAHDVARGLLLIEDLGVRLYLPALHENRLHAGSVDALYGEAMDALLRMQTMAATDGMAPYDAAFLRHELAILPEWFLVRHLGYAPSADEAHVLEAAFEVLLRSALEQPRCFVHRDFHSRNLLIVDHAVPLEDASGPAVPTLTSPGIIDFQGALFGPLTYDLASLLRDCYIAWDEHRVHGWVESYRQRLLRAGLIGAEVGSAHFLRWFDLIGLQRHLKVLGIFCRLWYRDGKRGYLDDLPLVYRYVVEVAGRYPELAALRGLLERAVGGRDLTVPTQA
jgi:aminoglycoside/choline kinase family phosphotransferase